MTELGPGIYERLITEELRARLDELAMNVPVEQRPLNSADAADRIAWHVSQQVERALADVGDERRVEVGLQVARALLDRLGELVDTTTTRADSSTGLRYRHHGRDGRTILLFSRLRSDDRAFWFLGPATFRGHVGERPMAVTWELEQPLSGDLYQAFAAAVA